MQFDRQKFKDVVHYVCASTRPDELGRTKLHKVMYFADMIWFLESGAPMTGAEYRKQKFGPCASQLSSALRELESESRIRQRVVNYFGYQKTEFESTAQPTLSRLSDPQKHLIDDIVDFVCRQNSAKTISEFSHNRAWDIAGMGEVLPYATALELIPVETDEAALAWARAEAGKFEDPRSPYATVQRRDYRAFRNGVQSDRR